MAEDSSSVDDFLRDVERDARKILQDSNARRKGAASTANTSTTADPPTKPRHSPVKPSKAGDATTVSSPLSSNEIVDLSRKALSLSSPTRKPLVPSASKEQPAGVTSEKVLRSLSSTSTSKGIASQQPSPFLASPAKKLASSSKKKKSKSKKQSAKASSKSSAAPTTPQRAALTKKQWSSSLSTGPNSAQKKQQSKLTPVDLSTEALRKRYRCEQTRAEAYEAYTKRKELRSLVNGEGDNDCVVVPDDEVPVEKHPIQEQTERLIARENERARERSRRKLESNAWQLDVHKQCMAELDRLREEAMMKSSSGSSGSDENAEDSGGPIDERQTEAVAAMNTVAVIDSKKREDKMEQQDKASPATSTEIVVRNPTPNLSMRLAGRDLHHLSTLVPGCTTIGPIGGIFSSSARDTTGCPSSDVADPTQAVACFTRDPTTSAVKVTLAQAIETPIFSKPLIAWDPTQVKPEPAPHEAPSGVIPAIFPPNDVVFQEPLVSPLADARPSTVLILDPAAKEEDWVSSLSVENDGDDEADTDIRIQHRRHLDDTTQHGFPVKCYANHIEPDASTPTHAFGVTEQGLTLNKPCVTDMIEWKSDECTTKPLSKERTPLDYLYIAKSPYSGKDGGSPNEGTIFTILMNKYDIGSILRTTEKRQKEEQLRLQQLKADNRKKAELASKIKAATELMEKKLAAERERILKDEAPQKDNNDASNRHMDGNKSKSTTTETPDEQDNGEEAWQRRLRCSVIATKRDLGDGTWEERQLIDSKKRFYRNVEPCLILSDAASWDPPPGWERVALPVPVIDASDDASDGSEELNKEDDAEGNTDDVTSSDADDEKDDDDVGRLASLLAKNDSFVKAMATRLGVPEDKIRATVEDGSIADTDLDEDNDAVNTAKPIDQAEAAAGIVEQSLPQGYADVYAIKMAERLQRAEEDKAKENADPREKGGVRGYAWRKLPRAIIGEDFFHLNKRKIQTGTESSTFNVPNKPKMVGMVDPVKGITRVVDDNVFQTNLQTQFISDVKADRFKIANDRKKQKAREDSILNSSQQEALEQILNVPLDDKGGEDGTDVSIPSAEMGSPNRDEQPPAVDFHGKSNAELIAAAVDAVKCANYSILEHVLDELGLNINSRDHHGNTLLILAAQRGNKRLCKFLLRRSASMNAQNYAGFAALHYLYEYGHDRLAEYLISKGARDDLISVAGLSVYEGIDPNIINEL